MEREELKSKIRELMIQANVSYFQISAVKTDGEEFMMDSNIQGTTKHIKVACANSIDLCNRTLMVVNTRREQ